MGIEALEIPRGWELIPLPGYREHPTRFATYSCFDYSELPPIDRSLDDDLSWLLAEAQVEHSLGGGHVYEGEPQRPATSEELVKLLDGTAIEVPASFSNFIRSPPLGHGFVHAPPYLDLGDFPVAVSGGGWVIHFLSDQQWCGHWHLYLDGAGSEATVWTAAPYGFDLGDSGDGPEWAPGFDQRKSGVFDSGAAGALVCADSFSEFLFRFWIENEIWFVLAGLDGEASRELTAEQRRYVEHYPTVGERPDPV